MSFRDRLEMGALSILGSTLIRCLGFSYRINVVGAEHETLAKNRSGTASPWSSSGQTASPKTTFTSPMFGILTSRRPRK